MEALQYLLLVNVYLVLFYGFYALFLKNETFFKLNRVYLVGGAIMSFMIPFLQSDWIRSLFITRQVEEVTQNISLSFTGPAVIIPAEEKTFGSGEILLFIYLGGAILCLLRFLWHLYKVQLILKTGKPDHAYSFFNKIEVGSSVPNRQTVYDHELVHARQWHSADVILFEIVAIINWFNPVVYLYRKAIKYIHEFTADEIASRHEESKEAYALMLVSKTFGVSAHQLTNSFYNHSLLKRRIIMLHKSKSTRNALLKYGLSAPLFAVMMILSSATMKPVEIVPGVEKLSEMTLGDLNPFVGGEVTYEDFLKRNPSVKTVNWNSEKNFYVIYLKNGKKENYDLRNKPELTSVTKKYGKLPTEYSPFNVKQEKFAGPIVVKSSSPGSQDTTKGVVFTSVEVSPEPVGGFQQFYGYITKNFRYSESAKAKNLSGKIILQFVVERDGAISEIRVLRGLGSGLDEEAVRVLAQAPKWKPGIQNGKAVRVAYTLPLSVNAPGQKAGAIGDRFENGSWVTDIPKNALFILDGKPIKQEELDGIDSKSFKSVNVLKGEQATTKYGQKGKDGVIEIYTKKPLEVGSKGAYIATDSLTVKDGNIILSGKGSQVDIPNYRGLIVVDGVEITNTRLKALDPNTIESINVLKGDSASKLYGEKGKNGVIEVTTIKKN